VLGGAYRRPRLVHELEIALGELVIEWVPLPDDSPLIGRTIGEAEIRKRTGVTVIAIVRQPHPVAAVEPADRLERGDVLVTVGRLDDYESFRNLVLRGSAKRRDVTPWAKRAAASPFHADAASWGGRPCATPLVE
jgi:TrkA domain protein